MFDGERRITGPAALWALGLPVTHIHAALKWQEGGGSDKVYLLKASSYWPFSPQKNQVEDAHPSSTATWEGLPSHIDAAFRDQDGGRRLSTCQENRTGAESLLISAPSP